MPPESAPRRVRPVRCASFGLHPQRTICTHRQRTSGQGLGRLPHDLLVSELAGRLDDLVTILGDAPFFHGDRASAADLALFGMLAMGTSGPTPEVERLLASRSPLLDWRKRVDQATGGRSGV